MTQSIDPRNVDSGDWEVVSVVDGTRVSRLWISEEQYIERTEFLADPELVAMNQQSFNDSQNQRFGDGKVIARIPMHKWARELAPRQQEGDKDFTKWFLNHEDNRPYRTFRGKV